MTAAPSETARLARRTAMNLAGSGFSAVAAVCLVLVVTRNVGKATAGSVFAATSLFVVLQTAGRSGADAGLPYFMPRVFGPAAQRRLLRLAVRPPVVMSCAVAAVVVCWAGWLSHGNDEPNSIAHFLLTIAPLVPVAVAYDLLLAGSRALGRNRPTVGIEQLARPSAQLILTVVVLATGHVGWLAVAWGAPYLFTLLPALRASRPVERPELGSAAPTPVLSPVTPRALWSFSVPRALAALSQVTIQRLDIVLVAALRGVKEAALYTAATRFLVLGQLVNQAIALPLQPRLGVFLARNDVASADSLFGTATSWVVAMTWPLYLSFAVYASQSLQVFGHGYTSASHVVLLLSLAMLVAGACGPVDLVLIMAGRTTWNLFNTVLSLTVFLAADLLLIPHYGAAGAAVGWSLAILINNLLPLAQVRHDLGCWPITRVVLLVAAAAAGCFAVLPLAVRSALGPGWAQAVLAAMVGTVAYALVLWRLRRLLGVTGLPWHRRVTAPQLV